jgi:hypothetical protein
MLGDMRRVRAVSAGLSCGRSAYSPFDPKIWEMSELPFNEMCAHASRPSPPVTGRGADGRDRSGRPAAPSARPDGAPPCRCPAARPRRRETAPVGGRRSAVWEGGLTWMGRWGSTGPGASPRPRRVPPRWGDPVSPPQSTRGRARDQADRVRPVARPGCSSARRLSPQAGRRCAWCGARADSARARQGVCGAVLHPRGPPPGDAGMVAARCQGAASLAAHPLGRTVRRTGPRVDREMSLATGRGEPCVRSRGRAQTRHRAGRPGSAGPSLDGPGRMAGLAALPVRDQRRHSARCATPVGQRDAQRPRGACCQAGW